MVLPNLLDKYEVRQVGPLTEAKPNSESDSYSSFCQICSNGSLCVPMTLKHKRVHQVSTLEVCPCFICDEWFPSLQDLEEHGNFHDLSRDPGYLYCKICKFSSKAKVLKKLSKFGPYHIKAPGNKFMKEHIESHNNVYQCDKCEKSFNGKIALQGHALSVHGGEIYQCDVCEFQNKSKYTLNEHNKRKHINERNLICEKCERKFAVNSDLKVHGKVMHPETDPVKCLECDKFFKTDTLLSRHVRKMHRNIRKHICSECGKKFDLRGELLMHNRLHTGERPFACDICQAKFYKSGHRGRHMMIHKGVRPHICSLCGKGFIQNTNMVLHQSKCVKHSSLILPEPSD